MADYKTMYSLLFNAATDAVNILTAAPQAEDLQRVIAILQTAQLKCEERYIGSTGD